MDTITKSVAWVNPLALLCGFGIGILLVMYYKPPPAIVYKYPTPKTCGDSIFRDAAGNCYQFGAKEVNCDEHESKIREFPHNN